MSDGWLIVFGDEKWVMIDEWSGLVIGDANGWWIIIDLLWMIDVNGWWVMSHNWWVVIDW